MNYNKYSLLLESETIRKLSILDATDGNSLCSGVVWAGNGGDDVVSSL
jgi:hypothetical protein